MRVRAPIGAKKIKFQLHFKFRHRRWRQAFVIAPSPAVSNARAIHSYLWYLIPYSLHLSFACAWAHEISISNGVGADCSFFGKIYCIDIARPRPTEVFMVQRRNL